MTFSRRSLLSAVPLAALACGAPDDNEACEMADRVIASGSGIPPWHMWGASQGIALSTANEGSINSSQTQLASIRYKRPENWQFVLAARILGSQVAGIRSIVVIFDLTIGVGRSVIQLPGWHAFSFNLAAPGGASGAKYVTQVQPPPAVDGVPTLPGPCAAVTAETINLQCRFFTQSFVGADTAQILVEAQFAPSTHVRPEWYEHRYPGGELGGS